MKTEAQLNAEDFAFASHGPGAKQLGLTKREHFAGLAMQAICIASPDLSAETAAQLAVADADALLAALEAK